MSLRRADPARHAMTPVRTLAMLTVLLLPGAAGAGPSPRMERFSTSEGLSQNSVYCLLQDRMGFLWVGTENGINRYDGYGFQVFVHDPDDPRTLPSNQVRAVLEDQDGAIWIGTTDAGLARFDYHSNAFERFRHHPGEPDSLASDDVRSLAGTPDGRLWIATAAGVDRLDSGGAGFRRYRLAPDSGLDDPRDSVLALAVDPAGDLWAGTEGGLFRYQADSDRFTPYRDASGPFPFPVWALAVEGTGALWAGALGEGLARIDLRNGTRRWWRHDQAGRGNLSGFHVTAIALDDTGRVWVGTADRGLDCIDPKSSAVTPIPLAEDLHRATARNIGVGALLQDRSHILWIGTSFSGLLKTDLKASGFSPLDLRVPDGRELGDRVVFALAEDRDQALWIGGADGLYRVDPHTGGLDAYSPDPGLRTRPVYAVLPEDDGTLWIGTWMGGLVRFDPRTGPRATFRHDPEVPHSLAHDRPLALLQDSRGRLWVGTWGGGLDLLDPATGRFTHHRVADGTGLASDRIRALCEGEDGTLWVGTTGGGLSHFDPAGGRFRTYLADPGDPSSLSNNDVAYLHRSPDGTLWVATAGGLNRFDAATGRFASLRTAQGLANDAVTAVLEDAAGMIWAAHFAGITRLDPATLSLVNFDASDGLAGTEFNAGAALTSGNGTLLFGGVGGVTAVRPELVSSNPHPPRTVLTGCTVYGRDLDLPTSITVAGEIRLRHDQDFLGFEFTGLEFTAPQRNTYAYRLTGYHQDWVPGGSRRFASYTNLRPGSYLLEIRAANNHGVWGEPARLRIVIAPPFWQTWWFRSAALAALGLAVLGVFLWRTRALRLRLAEQERLVGERTAQLAAANAELRAMATRDELTGVANRRLFNSFLDAEWRRSARFSRLLSLAVIDIDDFKHFNDTFGHPAGDACLQRVATALQTQVNRPGDLLARYGGEEFVVVLSETGAGEAAALAERMRAAVADLAIPHAPESGRAAVTISIGVATVTAAVADSPAALVAAADAALYAAKTAGKNRVSVAPPPPSSPSGVTAAPGCGAGPG